MLNWFHILITNRVFTMLVRFKLLFLVIAVLVGCGHFERHIYNVVSPDEVVESELYCITLIRIPVFCVLEETRTITVTVDTIVTEVVEIIVEEEIIREVILERVVTEIITIYISTTPEIHELVNQVIKRVKELVPEEEILEVPLEEIVDEVINSVLGENASIENSEN